MGMTAERYRTLSSDLLIAGLAAGTAIAVCFRAASVFCRARKSKTAAFATFESNILLFTASLLCSKVYSGHFPRSLPLI